MTLPLTRAQLKELSQLRLVDAKAMLRLRRYDAAYYLAGYSVECALKAVIAGQTVPDTFPRRDGQTFYTHDLVKLLTMSKLGPIMDQPQFNAVQANWIIIKDWKEDTRYLVGQTEIAARDIITAIGQRGTGFIAWIQPHW